MLCLENIITGNQASDIGPLHDTKMNDKMAPLECWPLWEKGEAVAICTLISIEGFIEVWTLEECLNAPYYSVEVDDERENVILILVPIESDEKCISSTHFYWFGTYFSCSWAKWHFHALDPSNTSGINHKKEECKWTHDLLYQVNSLDIGQMLGEST